MNGAVKWVLIIVAAYLGWRFLSGVLNRTVSYSTGTSWGGGIVPSGSRSYTPNMGYYAPVVYQPPQPQWWQGLQAGYDPSNGFAFGFNNYGGY